jgi:putative glutathione S-transferase
MGVMINGTYHMEDPGADTLNGGEFKRAEAKIRDWITPDGPPFPPAADRYHLYVAWNCPWAHRALIAREILGLKNDIPVSFARPRRTDQGWVFDETGEYSDPELGVSAIHEVYAHQHPGYTGRCTMPVLWDRETRQIVSNESADIIRMFLTFNKGIDAQLQKTKWLTGDQMTEADLRLFPTLARFDVAYHYAFKCNIRRITDYPALWTYARRFYAMPGIADTVRFEVYKNGYHSQSELRNPLGIIPAGPQIDWSL